MNEKRRREQETAYMEELADYISGTVNDVNKAALLKQDKCAILNETVTRVKDINSAHGMCYVSSNFFSSFFFLNKTYF